jgi:hypothetical protein
VQNLLITRRVSIMAGESTIFSAIVGANNVYKFYVGGEWKESQSGKSVSNQNPTTRQTAFLMQGIRTNLAKHVLAAPEQRVFCSVHPAGSQYHVRHRQGLPETVGEDAAVETSGLPA